MPTMGPMVGYAVTVVCWPGNLAQKQVHPVVVQARRQPDLRSRRIDST
jgi:hypothetical protein